VYSLVANEDRGISDGIVVPLGGEMVVARDDAMARSVHGRRSENSRIGREVASSERGVVVPLVCSSSYLLVFSVCSFSNLESFTASISGS